MTIILNEYIKSLTKYNNGKNTRHLSITDLAAFIKKLSNCEKIVFGEYFCIIPFYKHLKYGVDEYDLYDFCVNFKLNPSENEKKEHNQKEREMEYHSDVYFKILTEEHRDKMWILLDKFDAKGFVNALNEYFIILVNVILPQIYEKDIKNRCDNEYLGYFSFEISSK